MKPRRVAAGWMLAILLPSGCESAPRDVATAPPPEQAASTPSTPATTATTPIPAPPTATLDKSALDKALADRLTSAASDQARYDALPAVMQALAIGVYTSDGQAAVSGAERGPNDFYLYDFELRLLAQSLATIVASTRRLPCSGSSASSRGILSGRRGAGPASL